MSNAGQLETADSQAFWASVSLGKLTFQKCAACGHVQHPPRHQCSVCWEACLEQVDSTGAGIVESMTVVRRAPVANFRAKVPYVVVAVEMDEGPRLIANLFGEGAMDARPGDRVQVEFIADETGRTLPQFRLENRL